MKNSMITAIALALFATAAVASPPLSGGNGDTFTQSGVGAAVGGTSSFSSTGGMSVTGVIGNGGASQESFSGAAQADRASFESSFEDGKITISTDTLSQGESISTSEGWTYGNALGATASFAVRDGFAVADSAFATGFTFGTGGTGWTPPGLGKK